MYLEHNSCVSPKGQCQEVRSDWMSVGMVSVGIKSHTFNRDTGGDCAVAALSDCPCPAMEITCPEVRYLTRCCSLGPAAAQHHTGLTHPRWDRGEN